MLNPFPYLRASAFICGSRWTMRTPLNGSIAALVDSNGDIQEGTKYTAYGEATILTGAGNDGTWFTSDDDTATAGAIGNPYTYTARRLDDETGLMYFRFRMYRPDRGIFTSADPLGYVDGMSLYLAYFAPDGVDPMGLAYIDTFCCTTKGAKVTAMAGYGIVAGAELDYQVKTCRCRDQNGNVIVDGYVKKTGTLRAKIGLGAYGEVQIAGFPLQLGLLFPGEVSLDIVEMGIETQVCGQPPNGKIAATNLDILIGVKPAVGLGIGVEAKVGAFLHFEGKLTTTNRSVSLGGQTRIDVGAIVTFDVFAYYEEFEYLVDPPVYEDHGELVFPW